MAALIELIAPLIGVIAALIYDVASRRQIKSSRTFFECAPLTGFRSRTPQANRKISRNNSKVNSPLEEDGVRSTSDMLKGKRGKSFIFEISIIMILGPSAILWTLMLAAYSKRRARRLRTSKSAEIMNASSGQFATLLLRLAEVSPAMKAQLRIYGLCLTIAMILQTVFISLNFWHASMHFVYGKILPSPIIMLGYQLLSMAMVSPLFVGLQVELNRRFNANSLAKRSHMQSVVQILLFSVIAFLVLPICEAARVSLGLSGTPEWLVRDLFGVSIALSTIPSAALALSIVFILPEGLKRLKASEIQSYKNFLKEENFHVSLLEEKADEEVNKIITVANHFGELDKAEVLSSVLLKRHLNAITPPGRVL